MEDRGWFEKRNRRSAQVDNEFAELLGVLHEIFNLCESYAEMLQATRRTADLVSVLLYFRLVESAEAIVWLCRFGFDGEAAVVARSLLETMVNLKLCCEDKEFQEEYLADQRQSERRMAAALASSPDPSLEEFEPIFKHILRDTDEHQRKVSLGSFEQRCQRAEMQTYYDLVYRSHSFDTHGSAHSLMRYLEVSGEQIESLNFFPSIRRSQPGRLFYLAGDLLLRGLFPFLSFMGVEESEKAQNLLARLDHVGRSWMSGES